MRLIALTIATLVILLNCRSPMAYDRDPAVTAALTIYSYIIRVEATIQTCGRADPENAASYDKIYSTYHNEVARTVMNIGFLVGREAHLKGVEKEALFDSVGHLTETVMQDVGRRVELDSRGFIDLCHDLPRAAAANAGLFAPLTQQFPQEMNIIVDSTLRPEN